MPKQLEQVWPEMEQVVNLSEDLLQGPAKELDQEEQSCSSHVPLGFVAVTFRSGECSKLIIDLDPAFLPTEWLCQSMPASGLFTLTNEQWQNQGCKTRIESDWPQLSPPTRMLVRWASNDGKSCEGFLPINVDNPGDLPAPIEIRNMSSDDLLMIIAASDPGAALRVWAARKVSPDTGFDEDLDSANTADLDPLRNYALANTFLHRIRNRARVFARLKQNVERPVRTKQALLWRLEGFIGVRVLSERLCSEAMANADNTQEALLSLIDFTILLREVNYVGEVGALSPAQFDEIYLPFLRNLVRDLDRTVKADGSRFGKELISFWGRTVIQCQQ